ncbi:MAG: hypothetical protein O2955_11810 [Planctomycetota bacterium]|nr:hypothetical protein [Planctomycetota bacterium]MDA1213196.1 hypothetical protein [Planctomycetota bacterium]
MRHGLLRISMGLLLPITGLLALSATVHGADVASTEKLLPPKVLVYFSIPSVEQLKQSFNEGSSGKLFSDPEFAEFARQFDEPIKQFSDQFEEKVGLSLGQVLNIPTGEISLAVVAGEGSSPIGVVGFFDFGDHREEIDKLLALGRQAAEDDGATISTTDVDGTEIVKFFPKDGEESENGGDPDNYPCYFIKDSLIVVSNHQSYLEATLTRWDGQHARTFGDNIEYKYIMSRCASRDGNALMKWYINPMSLVQTIMTIGAAQEPGLGMAMGFMPILGLDRLKGIGGAVQGPTDEFEAVTRSFMFVDLPARGVLAMFQLKTTELTPPKWVSADTSAYSTFQWDIEAAYAAVEQMVDSFQGAGALDRLVDQAAAEGPQIHLKKDVLDKLSGQFHIINDASFDADASDISELQGIGQFLLAIGLTDQSAFESVVQKAIDQSGGFPGETRDFKGTTIYEGGPDSGQSFAFAITQNNVFVTNDVTKLEAVIRDDPDQKSLADSDQYKRLAEKMPQQTAMLSYQRQDTQMEAVYEMFRSGTFAQLMGAAGENPLQAIDFSLLPAFESLKKYLTVSGGYAEADDQGVLFTGFQLKNDNQ